MDIIEKVRSFVEGECKKPTSKYGYEPYSFHFAVVASYAEKLADELGGDKEIIVIAAWLHDMGSIIYGRKDHHITGAKIAQELLEKLKYPQEKIDIVKQCILNHRGSEDNERHSIEEKIVAEADVLSNFDNIAGIFKASYTYENMTQGEARDAVKKKLQNKWRQLHFERSKEVVQPKYEAAMLLLSSV